MGAACLQGHTRSLNESPSAFCFDTKLCKYTLSKMARFYSHRGSVVIEDDDGQIREITSDILNTPIPGVPEAVEELRARIQRLLLDGEGNTERPNSILVCLGARRVANRLSELDGFAAVNERSSAAAALTDALEAMLNHVSNLEATGSSAVARTCTE